MLGIARSKGFFCGNHFQQVVKQEKHAQQRFKVADVWILS